MRVHVCGVRGSMPATGSEYAEVGGNTSCVAIAHDGAPVSLILDAGTGIRRVAGLLDGAPFRGTLLLGHLHWDHIFGLPFFSAGDRPDATVRVLVPEQGVGAEELLTRVMAPPHFPITPAQLRGRWSFGSITEGVHRIEGFEVLARAIPHKGGRTLGFRVRAPGGTSLAYLSDHAPQDLGPGPSHVGALHEAARALAAGVDVLIHDAQFTRAELPGRSFLGHAAADYAAELAREVGARRVLLFHHDPARTDAQAWALLREVRRRVPGIRIDLATETTVVELGGRRP